MKIDFQKDAMAWDAVIGLLSFEDIGLLITALYEDDTECVDVEGKEYLLVIYKIFRISVLGTWRLKILSNGRLTHWMNRKQEKG